jgi:hypothetical protein
MTESIPSASSTVHKRVPWILADDGDGLSRRNVVPGTPVFHSRIGVEIFLDRLLSARKSEAPAHWENMAELAEANLVKAFLKLIQTRLYLFLLFRRGKLPHVLPVRRCLACFDHCF